MKLVHMLHKFQFLNNSYSCKSLIKGDYHKVTIVIVLLFFSGELSNGRGL